MKKGILLASVLITITGLTASLLLARPSMNQDSNTFTMTGTLEVGVEAGCMILRADNGTQYLLVGWSSYPPPGTRVAVTGYVEHNLASYCMQGEAAIHVVSISIAALTTSMSIGYGTVTATAGTATVITGSSVQSTTISGVSVTISGYVYEVVETPQCYPQCGAPSFLLTYLYVPPGTGCTNSMGCYPPPQYYRLLNIDGSFFRTTAPNAAYATLTGIMTTPSAWTCDSFYAPRICMLGDLYVQNITYSASSQSDSFYSTTTTYETSTGYVPIPGFELSSILVGFLVGLAIVAATRHQLPRD